MERAPNGPYKRELLVYSYEYILKNNPSALEPEIVKFQENMDIMLYSDVQIIQKSNYLSLLMHMKNLPYY